MIETTILRGQTLYLARFESQAEYDAWTVQNNARNEQIAEAKAAEQAARARRAVAANERRVAREAAAIKAARCDECFAIHAGECY